MAMKDGVTLTFLMWPPFLRVSSLLLEAWLASSSAYDTRFGCDPRDMIVPFRLSLSTKE